VQHTSTLFLVSNPLLQRLFLPLRRWSPIKRLNPLHKLLVLNLFKPILQDKKTQLLPVTNLTMPLLPRLLQLPA
jgi:hypothetical protein